MGRCLLVVVGCLALAACDKAELGRDTGPATDAALDGGPPVPEDGGDDAGGSGCAAEPSGYLDRQCASTTLDCVRGCRIDRCVDDCVAADPNADGCDECLVRNDLVCAIEAGCRAQWEALSCCPAFLDCLALEDPVACARDRCAAQYARLESCELLLPESACAGAVDRCGGRD